MPKKTTKKQGTFRQRAAKHKKDIENRHKESQERKDEGFAAASILKRDEFPKELEIWQPKIGEHILDVVPFYAGKQHPRDPQGDWSYVVDMWVHRNVGPSNMPFACNQRNFEKRCAICDYIAKHDLTKKEFNRIKAKRRCIYLVWVHDEERKEEKKGVQVFEVAHWFFEKPIDGLAKKPRGGGVILWADHDRGKSVLFRIRKEGTFETDDGKKVDSLQYGDFQFYEREEKIPDKILDHGIALDELIEMHSNYKEAKAAVYASDQDDIDQEVEEDEDDVTEDESDDIEEDEEVEEDEVEEEEETENTLEDDLKEMSRTELKVYIRDNELDVKVYKKDTDDEIRLKILDAMGESPSGDEDAGEDGECPADGGTYGKDADSYEECLDCDVYEKCAELSGV